MSKVDLDKSHNDVLNAQLNLTLEESSILDLEARKTSLTDSTQSQIDLSRAAVRENRISDRNPPAALRWPCWPLPTTW